MTRTRLNEKGVTLVEALAVLAIIGFLSGTILFLLQQTNGQTAQLQRQEQTAKEARSILNHMVQAIRKELAVATSNAAGGQPLKLVYGDEKDGHSLIYTFDSSTHSLVYQETQSDGTVRTLTLSDKVDGVTIIVEGSKISIELVLLGKGGKPYPAATTAYLPDL
ncbi:type II secretion system protein [Gorillibacterium sp. CAU 1737]|uniref:type II secretion system protein n=1 Tax=Gorillibacterium sp. CAU 1737 TaxID=3140362 RepID=UPI003260C19F